MITYSHLVFAQCDKQSGRSCWNETTIQLELTEDIEMAIAYLVNLGWEIDDPNSICPFCSKGLTQTEAKKILKRVK